MNHHTESAEELRAILLDAHQTWDVGSDPTMTLAAVICERYNANEASVAPDGSCWIGSNYGGGRWMDNLALRHLIGYLRAEKFLTPRPIDPALVQIVDDLPYYDRFGRVWHPTTGPAGYWVALDRAGYADDESDIDGSGPVARYFGAARDADAWFLDRLRRKDPPTTLSAPFF